MKDKAKHIFHRDVQDVLDLIGGRWRGAIMASLCNSPKRFLQLKEDLAPVTSKVLIKELRYLEQNKLINALRSTEAENSVVYAHSEHGKSCAPVIIHLHDWAKRHREVMLKAIKEG
ncbi:winged helix-turn-helix transcriptional regulator [Mucilaginibacter roseus]|uniref:Winged helix-turn-helix transcriptional regulator n=1 Tax=Mucilaginibacter roseus TaxID=1528868 RepID=A0ABS8TW07_9SPHI|nr:winged helix-turn-helix transcriptional regulator [Mucilaginibacter roseus]MCD8739011.1 winged helix-turn-helix transcriptional regulator [Mucilaginibacter roseus]